MEESPGPQRGNAAWLDTLIAAMGDLEQRAVKPCPLLTHRDHEITNGCCKFVVICYAVIGTKYALGRRVTGRGYKGPSRILDMFYIWIWVVVV